MQCIQAILSLATSTKLPKGRVLVDHASDIAASIIDQLTAQSDSFQTWTMAVIGGIITLVVSVVNHNHGKDATKIDLYRYWIVVLALVLEGLSLLVGRVFNDALASMTPILYGAEYRALRPFTSESVLGGTGLQILLWTQFILMFLGIVVIATFGGVNFKRMLRRENVSSNKTPESEQKHEIKTK